MSVQDPFKAPFKARDLESYISELPGDVQEQLVAGYIAAAKAVTGALVILVSEEDFPDVERHQKALANHGVESVNYDLWDIVEGRIATIAGEPDVVIPMDKPRSSKLPDVAAALLEGYRSLSSDRPATVKEAVQLVRS